MATCHFEQTTYKTTGRGGTLAKAYYISREEAKVGYLDRSMPTTRYGEDLICKEVVNMPDWAQGNAARFFRLAAQHEQRVNGIVSTEWKFSLPRELSLAQRLTAGREFARTMLGDRHPYLLVVHEPRASDGQTNPHVHLLWSNRMLDGIERTPEQFFRRPYAPHPERGGAPQDRALGAMGSLKHARIAYTDTMNLHLERAGATARLHPEKLEAQGVEREPEKRLPPSHSTKAKYHQEVTPQWGKVLASRAARVANLAAEQQGAQAYWEQRKMTLGITPDTPHEVSLQRVGDYARARATGKAPAISLEDQRAHTQALKAHIGQLENYHKQLSAEDYLNTTRTARRLPHHAVTVARQEQLLAEGQVLGIAGDDRQASRARARLEERQRTKTPASLTAVTLLDLEDDHPHGPGLRVKLRARGRDGLSY